MRHAGTRRDFARHGPARHAPTRWLGRCFALLALVCWPIFAAARGETTLFRHFTLIDGRGGAPVPDAVLLVGNGRVLWAGPGRLAPQAADARTVDLGGKYVIPGLIDTHVHVGNVRGLVQDQAFYTAASVTKNLATYASFGVTSVAVMGTDKDLVLDLRRDQRSGRPVVARLFTAGQGIVYRNGYGGVPGVNHPVATPAEATAEVDAQAAKGVDYIKLWLDDELGTMAKLPPEISLAVIEAAHRHGLRAFAHVFYLEDAKRLARQGIDGFVHSVRDQPIDDELIALMQQHGTAQIAATLSREKSLFTFARPTPIFDDLFFQHAVDPATLAQLRSPTRQLFVQRAHGFAELPGFFETAMSNVRRLQQAGIPVGAGTDSGPPGRYAGYFLHWELELLVQSGLTPGQALYTATGGAAAILGARDIGTLEGARWADMVVLDADPLSNIRNTRRIAAVYIAGTKVPSIAP